MIGYLRSGLPRRSFSEDGSIEDKKMSVIVCVSLWLNKKDLHRSRNTKYKTLNPMNPINAISIRGYVPGAIGRITELHGRYYSQSWGFGKFFEAKVATELSEFLGRFDERRDGFWTACAHNKVEGSIVIDGMKAESEGAHLRWYIVSNNLNGQGIGSRLLSTAMDFCRMRQYQQVFLWTFEGLDSARYLYEKSGFKLIHEQQGSQWGTTVNEQKYICNL
jgi:GNAT superfamily N-acetyltransferase